MSSSVTDSNEEDKARKAQKEADAVLEAILADTSFNEFEFLRWKKDEGGPKVESDAYQFARTVFPLLTRYWRGTELDTLTKGYQWLADHAIPSKRHVSARAFQNDPTRNLTILAVYIKLQVLKIYGSTLMQSDPFWCMCFEGFKIIQARRWALNNNFKSHSSELLTIAARNEKSEDEEDNTMILEFGAKWRAFTTYNDKIIQKSESGYSFYSDSWFSTSDVTLYQKAMSVLLENSITSNAYGNFTWGEKSLAVCWNSIIRHPGPMWTFIPEQLFVRWKGAISGTWYNHPDPRELWREFSENLWLFCLAVGSPKGDRSDPFKNLDELRYLISQQFAYTADLHNRIYDLRKQIILQQRMITALAYRNVLENLSAESGGFNPTEKWHRFVEDLFKEAKEKTGKISPVHPFLLLYAERDLDKRNGVSLFKEMAKSLFSDLSRTIHFFQSSENFDQQYTPMPGQFDAAQIAFMVSIRPLEENFIGLGEPSWGEERKRYSRHNLPAGVNTTADPRSQANPPPAVSQAKPSTNKKAKKKKLEKWQDDLDAS